MFIVILDSGRELARFYTAQAAQWFSEEEAMILLQRTTVVETESAMDWPPRVRRSHTMGTL